MDSKGSGIQDFSAGAVTTSFGILAPFLAAVSSNSEFYPVFGFATNVNWCVFNLDFRADQLEELNSSK
jgi:hypothetical protein